MPTAVMGCERRVASMALQPESCSAPSVLSPPVNLIDIQSHIHDISRLRCEIRVDGFSHHRQSGGSIDDLVDQGQAHFFEDRPIPVKKIRLIGIERRDGRILRAKASIRLLERRGHVALNVSGYTSDHAVGDRVHIRHDLCRIRKESRHVEMFSPMGGYVCFLHESVGGNKIRIIKDGNEMKNKTGITQRFTILDFIHCNVLVEARKPIWAIRRRSGLEDGVGNLLTLSKGFVRSVELFRTYFGWRLAHHRRRRRLLRAIDYPWTSVA